MRTHYSPIRETLEIVAIVAALLLPLASILWKCYVH